MTTKPLRILMVDDEAAVREVLSARMEGWGYEVAVAGDVEEAERMLAQWLPDVVVSDIVMPGVSGLELLKRLKRHDENLPVIMITAHAQVDAAVEAMKSGAQDFLTKPLDYPMLHALLESTAAELRQKGDVHALETRLDGQVGLGRIIGQDKGMRELYKSVERLASSDASAIITGESGVGKEVVARTIHDLSDRSHGPFVAVNAAAIPDTLMESELFGHEKGAFTGAVQSRAGCFELANGGTLMLDEIAEMPVAMQPKLLRILEGGRVRRLGGTAEVSFDVRVLAATNRPPALAVKDGLLREDLYYRMNVFELVVPPLRERPEDIPLLTQYFVRELSRKHRMPVEGVRSSTAELLTAHAWPGNVRELRNVIERAVILAGSAWIEPSHLPPYIQAQTPGSDSTVTLPIGVTLADAERALILQTLEHVGNNKAEAARQLNLDVKTIRNKLKSYGRE